jgi:hypothetical protein
MTDFPDLKLKALVTFPATVLDGAGIDVVKANGSFQFNLAYDDFAPPVGGISDPTHQNALLWNSITNTYVLAPVSLIGSGGSVPEAPNDGVQYGRQSLTWTPIASGGGGTPSNANPIMDGVAAPGVAVAYSRGDHVHPTDTSRAPLASPAFTGNPTAPTASPGDNDTSIATTAFVQAAVTASGGVTPSALTRVNDTNITLTLGGTPNTALLQATSITAGWSGTLGPARGGFGADISAANGVPLFAGGTATFTATTGTGNFARAADPVFTGNPTAPTQAPGDNDTSLATTAFVQAALSASAAPPRGYIAGLTLSTAGASNVINFAVGAATDSTNANMMVLITAQGRNHGPWASPGSGGMLDTGALGTINTWYHFYLIKRPDTGVVDVCMSLSATAPTLGVNIPAAYTLFRRIGAGRFNASSQWVKFIQDGNVFRWDTVVSDVIAAAPGNTAVTRTLTVPTGIRVQADVAVGGQGASSDPGPGAIWLSDLALSDQVASQSGAVDFFVYVQTTGGTMGFMGRTSVMTNTAAQIRSRVQLSSANVTLNINTHGWTDLRGSN